MTEEIHEVAEVCAVGQSHDLVFAVEFCNETHDVVGEGGETEEHHHADQDHCDSPFLSGYSLFLLEQVS